MYGFNIIQNGNGLGVSSKTMRYNNVLCENLMIQKFENDKVFYENDKYLVVLDGVVVNKNKFTSALSWPDELVSLYETYGDCFFDKLRGSFAGTFYDKQKNKLIVFTDQLGSKFVYYCFLNGVFICSLMMDQMYKLLKENKIDYHLDETGAFLELSYGFMLEDYTLCKEIKKVEPGQYLVLNNGELSFHTYYTLKNIENNKLNESQIIEGLEGLFTKAVRREFEKDNEYGYEHIVALSGGLDCRMTSFVGHECGFKKQLNCTFSQTDYLDETVSKEIASYLKHEWIFKSLDNGNWLFDVDETTSITGGNVLYNSLAHGRSLLKYLNFEPLGLAHTGQLGDVIISTHCNKGEKYNWGDGANSKRICSYFDFHLSQSDLDKEIGLFYNRYLNGTNNGIQYLYNYTESLSPFMDLDFIEFSLSIPKSLRANHYIYKKWITKKHPEAAKFVWESTGALINAFHIKIKGRPYPIKKIIRRGLQFLHILEPDSNSKHNMNPVDYYLNNNEELSSYLNTYFDYINFISNDNIKKVINEIKNNGNATEKLQAISLLSAVKMYNLR